MLLLGWLMVFLFLFYFQLLILHWLGSEILAFLARSSTKIRIFKWFPIISTFVDFFRLFFLFVHFSMVGNIYMYCVRLSLSLLCCVKMPKTRQCENSKKKQTPKTFKVFANFYKWTGNKDAHSNRNEWKKKLNFMFCLEIRSAVKFHRKAKQKSLETDIEMNKKGNRYTHTIFINWLVLEVSQRKIETVMKKNYIL